jgi:hypothetical protein
VQQMESIVAIFKDECDAGLWAAYLDGISTLLRITAREDLEVSFKRLTGLGIEPGLVILSARLYPDENPELVALIRANFPAAELLLISSSDEPSPSLMPLLADNVRHLAVNPSAGDSIGRGYFDCVLQALVAGRPLAIGDRLKEQTEVSVFELRSSEQKETMLYAVDATIAGEGDAVEMFRQRVALLADELMENALYGAPRDAFGGSLYRKGEAREMLAEESLVFSFGFDGETLAMEMTDNWGTLDPDLVVEYLAKNQAHLGDCEEMGGRGLFLIWRFFDHFHVSIDPGKKTVVGGDLQLSGKLDPEAPRGFHITTQKKGDAA